MNGHPPPCWAPLVTQQFRLRDLSKLTAHNVRGLAKDSVAYFTLHLKFDGDPLYVSNRVRPSTSPISTLEWMEITASNQPSRCVIIRLWEHADHPPPDSSPGDKVVLVYGVYFSGLVPITEELALNLRPNSLIFHTSAGFRFVAPDSLSDNAIVASEMPAMALTESFTSNAEIQVEIEASFPDNGALSVASARYMAIEHSPAEVKAGCSVEQLLQLQKRQLRLKYKREILSDLIAEISAKSALCLDPKLASAATGHYRRHNSSAPTQHTSMGRTLTKLLNMDRERPDPKVVLQALELRKSIERARFRCGLLREERDRARNYVDQLSGRLTRKCDKNVETDSEILANYHALAKEKEQYLHLKLTLAEQSQSLATVHQHLRVRRQSLLRSLNDIFEIREHEGGFYTINSISLPDAESFVHHIQPMSVSVALGYVAHIVLISATVLGLPLRNAIRFQGSQSKIVDDVKVLSNNSDGVFPLFCRVMPPPEVTQYAIYLLNQNIVQLQFELDIPRHDCRSTLANLMTLTTRCQLNAPDPVSFRGYNVPVAFTAFSSDGGLDKEQTTPNHRKISWSDDVNS